MDEEPVGSLGEEAVKLFAALSDWAGEQQRESEQAGAEAISWAKDVNAHIASGGAECKYCPLCQVIGVVRQTSPEVREHLTTAAAALAQAAAALLATPQRAQGTESVEKIDLDESGDWEE